MNAIIVEFDVVDDGPSPSRLLAVDEDDQALPPFLDIDVLRFGRGFHGDLCLGFRLLDGLCVGVGVEAKTVIGAVARSRS